MYRRAPQTECLFTRSGISRTEVLVILAIVFIIGAVATPFLLRNREQARDLSCRENLRAIGAKFLSFADSDPQSRLCTGASDALRDGCPDTFGWIADIRHIGGEKTQSRPASLHCPSNRVTGLTTLNTMLRAAQVDANAIESRVNQGICSQLNNLEPNSVARAALVRDFVNAGYSTNYTPSWFLVRGAPVTYSDGLQALVGFQHKIMESNQLKWTTGPLRRQQIERSDVPSSSIPLLSEASSLGRGDFERLATSIGQQYRQGDPLGATYTSGPAFFDAEKGKLTPLNRAESVDAMLPRRFPEIGDMVDAKQTASYISSGQRFYLQDVRAWGAVHLDQANVLMADGSLKQLKDYNGDRLFNPGFPILPKAAIQNPAIGYKNNETEINTFEIYTGNFLDLRTFQKAGFEDGGTGDGGGIVAKPLTFAGEQYLPVGKQAFTKPVGVDALSTFAIDVDTASYTNLRRFLMSGQLPPPNAIRIEELLNYFQYNYSLPTDPHPFSVNTELGTCPWQTQHLLLRIGIRAKEIDHTDLETRPAGNLVFLIDVSGSMRNSSKLPLIKQGLLMLVDQLTEKDHVSIVTYAGRSEIVLKPTPGNQKALIRAAISLLSADGPTAGASGIHMAYRVAEEKYNSESVSRVILCTDGDFNVGVSSQNELEQLIQRKRRTGIFLSVFGFGTGNIQDGKMEQLADQGNGVYAYIDLLGEARRMFSESVSSTLYTIAKDVKIQVEFNPQNVTSYRLIGYENRALAPEDFEDDEKDAGEINANHAVTALYEIVPAVLHRLVPGGTRSSQQQDHTAEAMVADPLELCTVRLRYQHPDGIAGEMIRQRVRTIDKRREPTADFEWQAAVACFGMMIRESPHRGKANYPLIAELGSVGLKDDRDGLRKEFLDLVQRARALHVRHMLNDNTRQK